MIFLALAIMVQDTMTDTTLHHALGTRRSVRDYSSRALPLAALQRLLWAAQGITSADGRRAAPSAHALYPLSLLLAAGNVADLAAGLYAVDDLEQTLTLRKPGDCRAALQAAAIDEQPWISTASAVLTICADMVAATQAFVEQPPYGQRGARYVCLEAGAAAQNVLLQATAEGLGGVLVAGFRDEATAAALNLDTPLTPVAHVCLGWPA